MRAEAWSAEELELENWAVKITSYQIGKAFLTEVESRASGVTLARGIAPTKEDSRREAFAAAARRLLRTRRIELTVGG
jgi:hypothetical protein